MEDQVIGAEEFQKLRGQEIGRILWVNNEIRIMTGILVGRWRDNECFQGMRGSGPPRSED